MSTSPYLIERPALISFSGGRTSAFMLYHIIQAFGGELPDDVVVQFCNTGKELEETLRFVHDCSTHWGVKVHWLEWRAGSPGFEEVGYNSASRNGEPFEALIRHKQFIPNQHRSICSLMLKVEVAIAFARSLGWQRVNNPVGLRRDEERRRNLQMTFSAQSGVVLAGSCPLYDAGVVRDDIAEFWSRQNFDLQLMPWEGNCDHCFKKGKRIRQRIMRDRPGLEDWWIRMEELRGAQFVPGREGYAELKRQTEAQPLLPLLDPDEEFDVECGTVCGFGAS